MRANVTGHQSGEKGNKKSGVFPNWATQWLEQFHYVKVVGLVPS